MSRAWVAESRWANSSGTASRQATIPAVFALSAWSYSRRLSGVAKAGPAAHEASGICSPLTPPRGFQVTTSIRVRRAAKWGSARDNSCTPAPPGPPGLNRTVPAAAAPVAGALPTVRAIVLPPGFDQSMGTRNVAHCSSAEIFPSQADQVRGGAGVPLDEAEAADVYAPIVITRGKASKTDRGQVIESSNRMVRRAPQTTSQIRHADLPPHLPQGIPTTRHARCGRADPGAVLSGRNSRLVSGCCSRKC